MDKNKLIEDIYGTIENKDDWNTVLVNISRYCLGHSGGGASLVPLDDTACLWRHGSNPDPRAEYLYYTHWRHKAPLALHVPRSLDKDYVYIDDSFLPDSAVDAHPFYQEYLREFGVRRVANIVFKNFRNERFILSLQTPVDARATTFETIKKNITDIIPYINQSLNFGMKFQLNNSMKESFEAFIYTIPYAVAFLDEKNQVAFFNEKMREMEKEGIFIRNGKIKIPAQSSEDVFETMFASYNADSTNTIKFFGKNGDLFIARVFDLKKNIGHASKFIIFNNVYVNKNTETLLKELFLSPSQARLACLIANGESIKNASLKLNITEGTTRQMMKEIFFRTGVNSQAKLVSFVWNISNISW